MRREIDLGRCFSDGWNLYKNNFALLLLSTLVATLLGGLTCGVLSGPLAVGLLWLVERLRSGDFEKPVVGDLFQGTQKFVPSLLCVVIFTVILMIVGAVPVIGQIAALIGFPLMMFALMYIAFDDLEAIDAIKRVFNELFSGALLMPVLVGVLANLAGSLGAILCGVGVFLTMPLIPAVFVCTYHQMKTDSDEILDADVVEPSEPFEAAEAPTGETKPD